MKSDIHPVYHQKAKVKCACGNEFVVGSTLEQIEVEICSACHPFYTGKDKVIDTAGRVERFKARVKAAKDKKDVLATKKKAKVAPLAKNAKKKNPAKPRMAKAKK